MNLDAGPRPGWAVSCLLLPALVHVAAILLGAGVDPAAIHASAPLCALPALLLLCRTRLDLPGALLLTAWIGWHALRISQAGVLPSVSTGRLAIDLLAGALALAVAGVGDGLALLRICGWSAAACLAGCALAGLLLASPNVGFGVPNHLFACTVPLLAALLWCEWRSPLRWRRHLAVGAVALGIAWAFTCMPGQPRRGALLALGVGLAAPWLVRWALRWPYRAASLGAAALLAVGLYIAAVAGAPVGEHRTQRLGMWHAGLEGISAWWGAGRGTWAAMRLESLPGDAVRTVATTGAPIDDPHCLPLAIVLEGGLPALAVALAVVALVISRLRASPEALRTPQIALGGALVVLLLIENAWSMPAPRLVLGAMLGMLLLRGRSAAPHPDLPAWPLVLLATLAALWASWRETRMALLPARPSVEAAAAAIAGTCLPQLAIAALHVAERHPEAGPAGAYHLAGIALRRFGPAQPLVRRRYMALKAILAAQPPIDPRDPSARLGAAWLNGEVVELAVAILRSDPFALPAMADLAAGESTPLATPAMSAAVTALRTGATPSLAATAMERDAVEVMGAVGRWRTGRLSPADAAALRAIGRRYPDSPGLASILAAMQPTAGD